MKMSCWKCNLKMKKIKEKFHGFEINGWKCPKCKEVIFDEKEIQPILHYNKLKESKKGLFVTVGELGKSKILRLPRIAEQLYNVSKGEKLRFDLEPKQISIKMR